MHPRINWIGTRIFGGIVMAVILAFLFGWIVMLLWNWVMPAVFGVGTLTFWQAWGLVILSHILFKSGSGHPNHHSPFQHQQGNWRDRFKSRMNEHFGTAEKSEVKPEE